MIGEMLDIDITGHHTLCAFRQKLQLEAQVVKQLVSVDSERSRPLPLVWLGIGLRCQHAVDNSALEALDEILPPPQVKPLRTT